MIEQLKLFTDSGLLILIWMVQLIIYPGFKYVDENSFLEHHKWYMRQISIIVVPLMFAQVGLEITSIINGNISIHRIILICLVWASTFLLSVPIHNKLLKGKDLNQIGSLVKTNWPRTIIWTAIVLTHLK